MAKTASNQLGICLRIMHVQRIPKVSIFMAVTTKIVPEKAQKWPKMARFWAKWHYNGRVRAREVFFFFNIYRYLSYVPSLVAPGHLGQPVSTNLSQFYGVCERSQPHCKFAMTRKNDAFVAKIVNIHLTKISQPFLPSPKGCQLLPPCPFVYVTFLKHAGLQSSS